MRTIPDIRRTDRVIVVGAGLAGLFTALRLAPMPVLVVSPVAVGQGASSAWAQGGIAAALGDGDSPDSHAADTVAAGAGLVDADVAALVTAEAPARIDDLVHLGTPFDRDTAGGLVQSREAAHSAARVCRVLGDTAGRAIMETVIAAVRATPSIDIMEGASAEDLLRSGGGEVLGVVLRHGGPGGGSRHALTGRAVVLATGGIGGLYAGTSNPAGVGGAGLGMAARAGAVIRDPEFVQFHPTGLAIDSDPLPLASEALRGEGAVLIDESGARVMTGLHPDGDLAPRDVVAAALHRRIAAGGRVFLDTRDALGQEIHRRFPTIAAACTGAGINPVREPIPVRPVQHYHMGGVATDRWGRSSLDGLFAVGEVACTGLHGANRLASNSLLEALVFGARAADAISGHAAPCAQIDRLPSDRPSAGAERERQAVQALRAAMASDVGIERDASGLARALRTIAALGRDRGRTASPSFRNLIAAGTLVAAAAQARKESRGGHRRVDHPSADPDLARPTRLTLDTAEEIRDAAAEALAA